jgi:hypothetical protein
MVLLDDLLHGLSCVDRCGGIGQAMSTLIHV